MSVVRPKNFFDYQLKHPKNRTNFAYLGDIGEELLKNDKFDQQAIEEHVFQKKKENRQKQLNELLTRLENEDSVVAEGDILDKTLKRDIESAISRQGGQPQPAPRELKDGQPRKEPKMDDVSINQELRQSRDGQKLSRRDSRVQSSKVIKGLPGDPNKWNDHLYYDVQDNSINRKANKAYNDLSHIKFLGAARPADDPELERLRKVQQVGLRLTKHFTYKQMLEEQMRKDREKRDNEKLLRKMEEERDLERIRLENELLDKRKLKEEEKERSKRKGYQTDKYGGSDC